jgi:chromosome partitioning protein
MKKIAISALKGGTGKSTITFNLAGVMAEKYSVLLVDIDPQASLSSSFVEDVFDVQITIKDLFKNNGLKADDSIIETDFKNISLMPANLGLSVSERDIFNMVDSQYFLIDRLEELNKDFDFILIDSPPNLGIYTQMALIAADYLIIPMECGSYSVKSNAYLLELIESLKNGANPDLKILGFLINRFDHRTILERNYNDIIRQEYDGQVFNTELENSVKYKETTATRTPITMYAAKSKYAKHYRDLLSEIETGLGI